MPTRRNVNERAVRRVRISAPTGDSAVLLADRAVVPFPGADRRVAPLRNLKQLCRSAAPAVDSAGDVQSAGVIAAGVERDVAVWRGGGGGLGESQESEQQRGDREGDQEGFMPPPPPDRASAAAVRRAWRGTVRKPAMCVTLATLHQRPTSVIPAQRDPSYPRLPRVSRRVLHPSRFRAAAERSAPDEPRPTAWVPACAGMTEGVGEGWGRRGRCLGAGGGEIPAAGRGYDGSFSRGGGGSVNRP